MSENSTAATPTSSQQTSDTPSASMPIERKPIRRVLLSVSDKTGLTDLARTLAEHGAELVATSSTAAALRAENIQVTEVSELTEFPEILGGRVKTLHPAIHGGLLARQALPEDIAQLEELDLSPFDAVVANLYPFTNTVASGATTPECIEMIDIGGPTMVRAAAKNHASVAIVTSPSQYEDFSRSVLTGGTTFRERLHLAAAAFRDIADYDIAIANWITAEDEHTPSGNLVATVMDIKEAASESNSGGECSGKCTCGAGGHGQPEEPLGTSTPTWIGMSFKKKKQLRYGENPHQTAALYTQSASEEFSPDAASAFAKVGLANATQLSGKELSYNNLQDTDAALKAVADFHEPTIAIIKHANPAGLASATTIAKAYRAALACDPVSAFGSVVASNEIIDEDAALEISKVFTEVVAAPDFTETALEILCRKPSLRVLRVHRAVEAIEFKQISGGLIAQQPDSMIDAEAPDRWRLVTGPEASPDQLADLEFAWRAVKSVKSNAILLAKNRATVGVGMGQVNRVDSAKLAVDRANTLAGDEDRATGSVASSDAFFPFADGLQILIDAGVTAVVSPGGSKRDPEVIAAAKESGITLYFTGVRHFWH